MSEGVWHDTHYNKGFGASWADQLGVGEYMALVAEYELLFNAWRDFNHSGRLDPRLLPEVAASWRRCATLKLDPNAAPIPVKLSASDLSRVCAQNRLFIDTALPFMLFLETAVRGTGFILVLTEATGIVLEAFGDESVMERARENNYIPGCCRIESEVGTNAIGLALYERKPIQLTGPEHFHVRNHGWTCASAPVFAPDGKILGTVTLSGESMAAHRHTMGLVISAAEAIHDRLRERELLKAKDQADRLLHSVLQSVSEAILTVDTSGVLTNINSRAIQILSIRPEDYLDKSLSVLLPGSGALLEAIRSATQSPPVEIAIDRGRGRIYFIAKPYLLTGNNAAGGAIIVITEQREFINSVREISGFNARFNFEDIVGRSPALHRQIELASIAARQDSRILITGETGTGKELFAQAIHNASPRSNGSFVAINCAAIPRDLLESEVFGYVGGAFTGARKGGQVGKLELADGGTVFLDEISQMPLDLQAKLLRVLQDGMITRLGDTKPVRIDARVVAATNEDLVEKSKAGGFRLDLYYRLGVVEVSLPALRERTGDIPLLTEYILGRIAQKFGRRNAGISSAALACLEAYEWPGNIRELENVLEMAVIVSDGEAIEPAHLTKRVLTTVRLDDASMQSAQSAPPRDAFQASGQGDVLPMKDIELEVLRATMKEYSGNIALVARKLGISRSTIYRRMKECGMTRSVQID